MYQDPYAQNNEEQLGRDVAAVRAAAGMVELNPQEQAHNERRMVWQNDYPGRNPAIYAASTNNSSSNRLACSVAGVAVTGTNGVTASGKTASSHYATLTPGASNIPVEEMPLAPNANQIDGFSQDATEAAATSMADRRPSRRSTVDHQPLWHQQRGPGYHKEAPVARNDVWV